ncbi:hypothetical protein Hlac_3433 (plasmid) [Halorubrum lacusprofundi ATCC 49239]|uniref:Uncharacterized protein n=1 Tax=Halorubrum lacusprofundi (strain ATCC 49239 / DSM 5036 / JCM 8891 / ACAM 34) TaxID=416348 RepID=B9LWV4_HALLT|nr:hypothetical protein Hlac_3433 [Halorubrum lacusprofundi ATCC 49239]
MTTSEPTTLQRTTPGSSKNESMWNWIGNCCLRGVLITTKQEITAGREYPGMHIRMGMNMSSVPTVEVDGGTVIRLGDSSMIMRGYSLQKSQFPNSGMR